MAVHEWTSAIAEVLP